MFVLAGRGLIDAIHVQCTYRAYTMCIPGHGLIDAGALMRRAVESAPPKWPEWGLPQAAHQAWEDTWGYRLGTQGDRMAALLPNGTVTCVPTYIPGLRGCGWHVVT